LHELETTIFDLMLNPEAPYSEALVKTSVQGLDLIPSNQDLSGADLKLADVIGREQILKEVLAQAVGDYDFILIDCQPTLGLLTVNALTAANSVIVPLQCEHFALRGVAHLHQIIEKAQQRLNPQLEIEGILATMYDSRTLHSKEVLSRICEAFPNGVFETVIARTVRFPDTTVAGEPITTFAPSSDGAYAYRRLARELIQKGAHA
ncbi:MAG: AAA family ATPase, partial [Actinomycetes bacterium]